MTLLFRLVIFSAGLLLSVVVFELVRKGRFREELSITWFLVGIVIMVSSVADFVIDPLAHMLGIGYPPALVFGWITFCLILALLYFSAVISDLKGKLKELSQKVAIMEFEMEKSNAASEEITSDKEA